MLQAVRMHYPKCSIRNLNEVIQGEDRLVWRRSKGKQTKPLDTTDLGHSLKKFTTTLLPNGPQNTNWLEKLNKSHSALQSYWKSVHDHYVQLNRLQDFPESDNETLLQPIEFWSSEKYRSLLSTKQQSIENEITRTKRARNPSNDNFLPLPKAPENDNFVPLPCGPEWHIRPELPESRAKEKTRGTTGTLPPSTTPAPTKDEVRPVVISLNKRSMGTIQSIFPTSNEDRSRTVPWDTFILLMEDAGFHARSGGGSIVIFEKKEGGGRINIHRPHPNPTLDPVMLQIIGRRMNKWFGWTRNIFTLAGK